MPGFRSTLFLACLALCSPAFFADARAATLSSKLTLANLPSTITLCRDSAAIAAYGFDEQWVVLIDIDGNPLTGSPGSGAEFVMGAQTISQGNSCSPSVVSTSDALFAALLTWDGDTFVQGPEVVDVSVDLVAHTLTLSTDTVGLTGLSAASTLLGQTFATYKPTGSAPDLAGNSTAFTPLGSPITDPSGNVENCTSPCSAGAPYYSMVDIVGLDPGDAPAQAFGANALIFEMKVSSLPINIQLCRYPAAFAYDGDGYDTAWLSAIDLDHDGEFDVAVGAVTTPQPSNCTSNSAPIETSVHGGLYLADPGGGFVYDSDLPVKVDVASGTITVQANRNDPAFAGLSASSVVVAATSGYYGSNFHNAQDGGTTFTLGNSFSDPILDVTNCSGSCSTGAAWYPQIDLIGGTVYLPNTIFASGFE